MPRFEGGTLKLHALPVIFHVSSDLVRPDCNWMEIERGAAVLDGIGDCLLGDPEKVGRGGRVQRRHGFRAIEEAINAEAVRASSWRVLPGRR